MAQFTETALEAVSIIGSGEKIWCHSMAATPTVLLEALAQHARTLSDVTIMQLHLEHAESIADPALDGHLRNRCFFAGKTTRNLINEGRADYVPMFLSEIPKLFRHREQQVDTALVQVSTPDQHGNCSLGISVEATAAACDVAERIIAHVNPNMPRTHGDSFINIRDIDYAYVDDTPLITLENKGISDTEQRIGEIVASRINDGDCLQMGIGAIPDAALFGDSTQPAYFAAAQYHPARPRRFASAATGYGTLGYALPAAFGSSLAGVPAIALIGDGGLQFTINELSSAVEAGLGVPVVVWNNQRYEMIAQNFETAGMEPIACDIHTPDFLAIAKGYGCEALRVDNLDELENALRASQGRHVTTLIECRESDFLSATD